MAYLTLALAGIAWHPIRALLTSCSIIVAFLLFGLLEPVVAMFDGAKEQQGTTRWWVSPKHSISDMLPVRYHAEVANSPGVDRATHITWFGGEFRDPASSTQFTRWAVEAESFLATNPKIELPAEQRLAFINTPTAAIVGRSVADQFGLKLNQTIPIMADIWHNQDGSLWQFDLVGIFDEAEGNTSQMYLNYQYFDEYRVIGKGLVSNIIFTTGSDADDNTVANNIDRAFADSSMETKTRTESEFFVSQINQLGNIALLLNTVMAGVCFTILLLAASNIGQSIRERRKQFATLKALGFSNIRVLTILLLEAFVLVFASAMIGLMLAYLALPFIANLLPQVSGIALSPAVLLQTTTIAVVMTLLVGLPPALNILRLQVADGLRGES